MFHAIIKTIKAVIYHLILYICNYHVAFVPSHRCRLWYYRRLMKFTIDKGASILMEASFDATGKFSLGENSTINTKCRIDTRGGITIGRNVVVAVGVSILTADHDLRRGWSSRVRAVVIGDFAFLATRSMILPGVKIGEGAVVGAGAVVTKDIPAWTIVAGVPASPIGVRERHTNYTTHYARLFH